VLGGDDFFSTVERLTFVSSSAGEDEPDSAAIVLCYHMKVGLEFTVGLRKQRRRTAVQASPEL
jgi:hypothetical protein